MDIKELQKPLDRKHVKGRKQGGANVSYIEGWHAIAECNRIFGFDGWHRETLFNKEISRQEVKVGKQQKDGFKVGYEAKVRITVECENNGQIEQVIREGTGHGSGIATDLFDCIEGAAKEAETDAMKRALMTFGNPFGLALYDKTQSNVEDVIEIISVDQATVIHDLIAETNSDLQKFLEVFGIESIQKMPANQYNRAISALNKKKAESK